MPTTFKTGDKAVYPAHGVGMVMGIEKSTLGGAQQDVFVLKILENNMRIMIPTDKVDAVGLRQVTSRRGVKKVYEVLKDRTPAPSNNQSWHQRQRDFLQKLSSGSILHIAEVLRDLYLLKFDKDLSFGERKLLDTARSFLIKEVSIARNVNETVIEQDLENIFHILN